MANGYIDSGSERVTIEIAKKLAGDGRYRDAYNLLHPLVNSQHAIEVSIIMAKIYAQNRDFESAEIYFIRALEIDENNAEAFYGLKKCRELKNSKIRTFFSFNKINILSVAIILLLACLLAVALNAIF